ncbi:carboxymuconolactone decarboxylase family protein [Arachidicoccus terrestris]|uniref:carboxymuconolactone decarboxylase family protein n=1 Tax=Arachidicoccus terrestris TaxID=2875539 RepID=UPI001CC7CC2C|nr:carboxymuconolactone decarboxylase family protein [Arachidicoccus terrestris]UAY55481.1 carboxymuconolactone decarboxylase family protein [Arachidicoccus terrestris]
MQKRINLFEHRSNVSKDLQSLVVYLGKSSLEKNLLHLVETRVSQLNGCAFCLDMHTKDLRAEGETEQRIYLLSAWRETSLYTGREQAALAWAEAVTKLENGQVSDEVYEQALQEFSEKELVDLTLTINSINLYNRFNIAFQTPAGDYQPGQFAVHAN